MVLLCFYNSAWAQCPEPSSSMGRAIFTWYVIDGDTLDIGADQRLRLAMINTPELGRPGAVDQPQARAAKQAVINFMHSSEHTFWRVSDTASVEQQQDRYGRHLGMLYNAKGDWLAEHLVAQGLAFVVSMPPYVAPDCLWQQESLARQAARGVWSTRLGQELEAAEITASDAGFALVVGKVSKVLSAKHDWFVELDGDIALRINKQQWRGHAGEDPETWLHQQVSVRGWLAWRSLSKAQRQRGYKHGLLDLSHPHMLQLAE